jgi:hypothetical protein
MPGFSLKIPSFRGFGVMFVSSRKRFGKGRHQMGIGDGHQPVLPVVWAQAALNQQFLDIA